MKMKWILIWWILMMMPGFIQAQNPSGMSEDSVRVLWEAVRQEREEIQGLIRQHQEELNRLKVQQEQNIKQISHYEKIKADIQRLLGDKGSGIQGGILSPLWLVILVIPILGLLMMVIYLRFRYRRDLKQINDDLHGYLTESRNLINRLSDELEKTTEESIEKAKSRLRILELLMVEAGQKIKPITSGQLSVQENLHKTKPNPAPESGTPGSGARIYDRYKSNQVSDSVTPSASAGATGKKSDKATMVMLLHRRGMSLAEIASQLDMGQGEVELILSLKKRSSS
ncbi:MAG: hypothetical protein KBA26_10265 [Candidatus Delongbacteria bacterium]|nr:hypothetical protein [Candidatus Delongbacteria bacterium]